LSYRIEQEDLETQQQLEKEISQLHEKFTESTEAVKNQQQAFSILQEKLENLQKQLNELEDKRLQYKEMLKTLRQDELKARETLLSLRKRLVEAKRLVQKSNLPGVPHHHLTTLESAEEKIVDVEDRLNEKPLEIAVVNQVL